MSSPQAGHARASGKLGLALGALGVVFGDIGTSPLYALRDTFAGHHPLPLDRLHVFGIISLMVDDADCDGQVRHHNHARR
jgi:KUP system potassium uptake protein